MSANNTKLDFEGMIVHLKNKNITFNYLSEEETKEVLKEKNYFFKLTSYRTNFDKNLEGKYKKLDFAMLLDLSNIDASLRRFSLNLCLTIEHSIKTALLKLITEDPDEDGYTIIHEFVQYHNQILPDQKINIKDLWGQAKKPKNILNHPMYQKYYENPPVWVIFEVISYTHLVSFAEFYKQKKQQQMTNNLKIVIDNLKYVKFLRNAAAHNNPLIRNIRSRDYNYSQEEERENYIQKFIHQMDEVNQSQHKYLKNPTIHHLAGSLLVFEKLVTSKAAKEHIYNEFVDFTNRCSKNKEYYDASHHELKSILKFVEAISENLFNRL